MKLRATTNVFADTSLYVPLLRLPYIKSAEFKLTLSTYTNDQMADGTYLIANT